MCSRIFVPVDLEHAKKLTKALNISGQTAKKHGAEVVDVDVVDAVPTPSARTECQRVSNQLEAFVDAEAIEHGIKANDQVALRGDLHLNVGPDIIKAATEADCDLIVMASRVPGFKDHILSSNAGHVASHAPMSVFVVR